MSKDLTEEELLAEGEQWSLLAMTLGYNELAKVAPSLGQKLLCRLLRDKALASYEEVTGKKVKVTDEDRVILTITSTLPHLKVLARDIELMRKCVAEYDALPVTSDPKES
jgi:hypothetical protein